MNDKKTYLTTEQLAEKLHYRPKYIREKLLHDTLHEGIHDPQS